MPGGISRLPRDRWWLIALSLLLPFVLWSQPVRDAAQYLFHGENYALKAWAYPAIDYLPLIVGLCIFAYAFRSVRGQVLWSAGYAVAMAFVGFWYILSWECATGNCL